MPWPRMRFTAACTAAREAPRAGAGRRGAAGRRGDRGRGRRRAAAGGAERGHGEQSGSPVAPDDIDALFEPFRRMDGRAGAPAGVGLGLSIVRAVATAHGARLDARPRSEGGLEIVVAIARASDATAPRSALDDLDLGPESAPAPAV